MSATQMECAAPFLDVLQHADKSACLLRVMSALYYGRNRRAVDDTHCAKEILRNLELLRDDPILSGMILDSVFSFCYQQQIATKEDREMIRDMQELLNMCAPRGKGIVDFYTNVFAMHGERGTHNALVCADLFALSLSEGLESSYTQSSKSIQYFPYTLTCRLGLCTEAWTQFLNDAYAHNLLFLDVSDVRLRLYIIPVCHDRTGLTPSVFPLCTAYITIAVSGSAFGHEDSVAHIKSLMYVGEKEHAKNERSKAVEKIIAVLYLRFRHAGYTVGDRPVHNPVQLYHQPFVYTGNRDSTAWDNSDLFCEHVARLQLLFQNKADVDKTRSDVLPSNTKSDIARLFAKSMLHDFDQGCLHRYFERVATVSNTERSLWRLVERSDEGAVCFRGNVAACAKVARRRWQPDTCEATTSKKQKRSLDREQEDEARAYLSRVGDGFDNTSCLLYHSSKFFKVNDTIASISKQFLSERRMLERGIGYVETRGERTRRSLIDASLKTQMKYWLVCSVHRCNESHRGKPLLCRSYGVVCIPKDDTLHQCDGRMRCTMRVLCGVVGTAYQLRSLNVDTNGAALSWWTRATPERRRDAYPLFFESISTPVVWRESTRLNCLWFPKVACWRTVPVRPVYKDSTLTMIYNSLSASATELGARKSDRTMVGEDANSWGVTYMLGNDTGALPSSVKSHIDTVWNLFVKNYMANQKLDGTRVTSQDIGFPELGFGTAATVCALELLQHLDDALCRHCVQQVFGVNLTVIKDGVDLSCDESANAIGSNYTLLEDCQRMTVRLSVTPDGYYTVEEHPRFVHVSLFHSVRMLILARVSSEDRESMPYSDVGDEVSRFEQFRSLLRQDGQNASTNLHAKLALCDEFRRDGIARSCLLEHDGHMKIRTLAESAWIYARLYVNPCTLLCEEYAVVGFDRQTIHATSGACGEIPLVRDAEGFTEASLRWYWKASQEGCVAMPVMEILSSTFTLRAVDMFIDGVSVKATTCKDVDLVACDKTSAHICMRLGTPEDGAGDSRMHGSVESATRWSIVSATEGTVVRIVTSQMRAQVILVNYMQTRKT
ncbi:hypothetical protein CYMTET_41667 [Cymbomonas tetramitiformis]|uniref:Uncharacterized protein n=1 Tax=Cymbomonas tetramitiformis TaxID=36881 RepID=A0AAE0C5M7_9CHLO|nr:hypothetical protein CYMTET_44661 [Cymbomonas tetramitiformis]KAK3248881.1 hypothetical protein CYMTET_41667 [Cymbomonas tetramitiformis]